MKICFIQPPRKIWPFMNYGDNYVLPLWMPTLAAAIRPLGHEIVCIDCMAEQIGWSSLATRIKKEAPDIVCQSEAHALYVDEAIRLSSLIKELFPQTFIIVGGGHVANQANELLTTTLIDVIAYGEGEYTLIELIQELSQEFCNLAKINGIYYREKGKIIKNSPRKLLDHLDQLPFPAYDLLPMQKYGSSKFLFSPDGTTIEHSRGCLFSCDFCVWWEQMAEHMPTSNIWVKKPRWRTKSVKRTVDEIQCLVENYNKRCFIFVDGTWNVDPVWNKSFAEEIIARDLKINWFAFMRADFLLRDEKKGIVELLVRSGLSHICIGLEHNQQSVLNAFNKKDFDVTDGERVIELFKRKYPSVFLQATFIVGNINETKESLRELGKYVKKLKIDFPGFHILTPVPGSVVYDNALRLGKIEERDFSKYDWNTPIMSTQFLTREDLAREVYLLYKNSVKISWLLKGLFSKSKYKRNMYLWWMIVTLRVLWGNIINGLFSLRKIMGLTKPSWYDS